MLALDMFGTEIADGDLIGSVYGDGIGIFEIKSLAAKTMVIKKLNVKHRKPRRCYHNEVFKLSKKQYENVIHKILKGTL